MCRTVHKVRLFALGIMPPGGVRAARRVEEKGIPLLD